MEGGELPPVKFCIRCEDPILPEDERFFRAIVVRGQRLVEYFCVPCFKKWNPRAAERLRA